MKEKFNMKFNTLILATLLLNTFLASGQKIIARSSDLQSKIDSIVGESTFNGVILITKDTTAIYSNAIGYSDLENKTLIQWQDQFVIGSISKQITAVLILREYEKGNIKTEDKISQFLDDIHQAWANEVTIHHLLTHTHGITDLDKPLEFKPGSQFQYSQLGFELLAKILEKVTGKSFQDLSTQLFEKYELENTFHPDNKAYKNLVKGYEESENGILAYCSNSLDNYVPAGGFISTTQDLIKWNQLLHSGKLVNKATLDLMKTKYATRNHPIFDTVEYGYGLLFKEGEENTQIGALGYAPGFVSACYFYPQTNMNLVVLANTAHDLNDFKKTFEIHTQLMELIKKYKQKGKL